MASIDTVRLTQFSSKGGCGCKIGPAVLTQVLRHLPAPVSNPNVLVGLESPDDAGVYRITDDVALVHTVDFFTPVVDDPYSFGQIAAANALSDVYAMGGRPISALNIVCFPVEKLPCEVLAEILRGGADKVHEAGAVVLGGHSIDDAEPKFGIAVTGTVSPRAIRTKGGVRAGDVLVLTKAVGIGVVTTAIKRGVASPADVREAVALMATLNDLNSVLEEFDVHALTDVTGFGLLGHASEMARASRAGLVICSSRVPVLRSAWKYAEQNVWPGGTARNRAWLEDKVVFGPDVAEVMRLMMCDPVTSGGLLIAVGGDAGSLVDALARRGCPASIVGECTGENPGIVTLTA